MQTLEILYRWYIESLQEAKSDAMPVRVALNYNDTALEPRLLEFEEFERWLMDEWKSAQLRMAWLRSFTEGRETEFESLMNAARSLQRKTTIRLDRSR